MTAARKGTGTGLQSGSQTLLTVRGYTWVLWYILPPRQYPCITGKIFSDIPAVLKVVHDVVEVGRVGQAQSVPGSYHIPTIFHHTGPIPSQITRLTSEMRNPSRHHSAWVT